MSPSYSIIPVLFLLGAAHGIFLCFALAFHKSGSKRANRYLACYTLVFVSALIDYFIDLTGLGFSLVRLRALFWPKEFLYGIFIYFYTRELTRPGKYSLQGGQWWHFAPAVIHVAVTWPLLLLSSEKIYGILYGVPGNNSLEQGWELLLGEIELFLTILQISIYLVLSIRLVLQHEKRVLQAFSFQEKTNLRWLRNLLIGTLCVYFCWLAEQFLDLGERWNLVLDFSLGLSMVLLIYSMSLLGLRQPQIFSSRPQTESLKSTVTDELLPDIDTLEHLEEEEKQKYCHSALSADMSRALMQEVESVMKTRKLYRDSSLSLPQLATELKMSVNYLSQVINQQAKQNFFDYINRFRIEEVKQLMQEKPDATILNLAMESGFNSKSAFYTAFRKHTGLTPGQFKLSLSDNKKSVPS